MACHQKHLFAAVTLIHGLNKTGGALQRRSGTSKEQGGRTKCGHPLVGTARALLSENQSTGFALAMGLMISRSSPNWPTKRGDTLASVDAVSLNRRISPDL
jgi:hypothetical protein